MRPGRLQFVPTGSGQDVYVPNGRKLASLRSSEEGVDILDDGGDLIGTAETFRLAREFVKENPLKF